MGLVAARHPEPGTGARGFTHARRLGGGHVDLEPDDGWVHHSKELRAGFDPAARREGPRSDDSRDRRPEHKPTVGSGRAAAPERGQGLTRRGQPYLGLVESALGHGLDLVEPLRPVVLVLGLTQCGASLRQDTPALPKCRCEHGKRLPLGDPLAGRRRLGQPAELHHSGNWR
jgi:hypothetical protein